MAPRASTCYGRDSSIQHDRTTEIESDPFFDADHPAEGVNFPRLFTVKSRLFIGSANFTGHAMKKNFEAGVLITGGHVPVDLSRHLMGLREMGAITEVR